MDGWMNFRSSRTKTLCPLVLFRATSLTTVQKPREHEELGTVQSYLGQVQQPSVAHSVFVLLTRLCNLLILNKHLYY